MPHHVAENVTKGVTDMITACLSVEPAARPAAAAALTTPAAQAALADFQERTRAFGGVDSNVRDTWGGTSGRGRGGSGSARHLSVTTSGADGACSAASPPHEPGTPLPGVLPGTPGHAPAWGESGTGCFTWGVGLTQPSLDRALLECDWLSLAAASAGANEEEDSSAAVGFAQPVVHVAFGQSHKLAVTLDGTAWWSCTAAECS
jgi:hypothetical protein